MNLLFISLSAVLLLMVAFVFIIEYIEDKLKQRKALKNKKEFESRGRITIALIKRKN